MRFEQRCRALTATIATALLAGCAPQAPSPRPSTPAPATVIIPGRPAPTPSDYVTEASVAALLGVRASELAATRGRSPRVRAFAASVVREQTGIAAQLNFAGRRLGLLPRARLGLENQQRLDALASAGDFDAAYQRMMERTLAEAYALHRAYTYSGTSPTLRPVASSAYAVVRREVERLQAL